MTAGAMRSYSGLGVLVTRRDRALCALCVLAPLAACGRIGFPEVPDASLPSDPPPCEPTLDWREPVTGQPFAQVNSPDTDWGGEISDDGLTVMFTSNRRHDDAARFRLWLARRAARDQPFAPAVALDVLNGPSEDRDPSFTDREVYFISQRPGGPCLHVSGRTGDTFEPPRRLAAFCGDLRGVYVSRDGLRLYYELDRQLRMSSRNSLAVDFTPGVAVAGLPSFLVFCTLSADELTIYCEGAPEGQQLQLWQAKRTSPTAAFSGVANVEGLSEPRPAGDPSLTPDGRLLLYAVENPSPDLRLVERRCR